MFTIVHFSDWHAMWLEVPPADLYICTGDMNPNSLGHWVDWGREIIFQRKFMSWCPIELPSKDAEVVCVRGNHDHDTIAPLFPNHKVMEIVTHTGYFHYENPVLSRPLSIGGMRGIKYIRGNSPDEMSLKDLDARAREIPAVDILVTHCAPHGILDKTVNPGKIDEHGHHTGSPALTEHINYHQPLLHCFGHIHEAKGVQTVGKTICSNAATGFNVIELPYDVPEPHYLGE